VVACHRSRCITATSAMVFMRDSVRAAAIAKDSGITVGLHLNLSQRFTEPGLPSHIDADHERVVRFLTQTKYAVVLYHPLLRRQFRTAVQAQLEEFSRLYGHAPSHIDGHQHQHLSSNVLIDELIPRGFIVRRSFSFTRGEKGFVNRSYRQYVDRYLRRRYKTADYFFALEHRNRDSHLKRVFALAETATVELMTHPVRRDDFEFLMSDEYQRTFRRLNNGAVEHWS
jgi:chitin disaccharide deacetylase